LFMAAISSRHLGISASRRCFSIYLFSLVFEFG
jgi:hypothetical protein